MKEISVKYVNSLEIKESLVSQIINKENYEIKIDTKPRFKPKHIRFINEKEWDYKKSIFAQFNNIED